MAETMLERVKAALIASDEAVGGTRHLGYWDDMARSAVEALREPTEEMCDAGAEALNTYDPADNCPGPQSIARGYTAMIDSILKEWNDED